MHAFPVRPDGDQSFDINSANDYTSKDDKLIHIIIAREYIADLDQVTATELRSLFAS